MDGAGLGNPVGLLMPPADIAEDPALSVLPVQPPFTVQNIVAGPCSTLLN